MASKIIVLGSINGQFPLVFNKLKTLQSKNSFSLAIVCGNLFADPQQATAPDDENVTALLNGDIDVPLPTYFALGSHALPARIIEKLDAAAGEVCHNLFFLGKRTTIKTSEGVRIVALGGTLDPRVTAGISKEKYLPFYSIDDAKTLRGANTADILITNDWPASVRTGSKVPFPDDAEPPTSQECVAELCAALRPRYHFSTTNNVFYEREPFFHVATEAEPEIRPITRFLSLAAFNNPSKQKWLYAFSLDPKATPPVVLPAGVTASPLSGPSKKRALPSQGESYSRFSNEGRGHHHGGHHRNKRQRQPPPTQAECFFCLSNPNIATHLITSIANETYLTTAKGPLTRPNTFPQLNFPSHILVIPFEHSPTLASIADPATRTSTYNEMQRYRTALHNMVSTKSQGALGGVTWEVSRAGGVHTHWQFLPMPADLIDRGLVDVAFRVEAENEKYPKFESREIGEGANEPGDFFSVSIWSPAEAEADGNAEANTTAATSKPASTTTAPNGANNTGTDRSIILPLSSSFRFDLQFGRRVLAKLLRLEDRISWKDCAQSHEDEVADAEAFKVAFKTFDFSLEE